MQIDHLADAWVVEHKDYREQPRPTIGWAFKELNRICAEEPFAALHVIARVLARDSSDPILEVLAAGPLENLLVMHGTLIIDEVAAMAGSSAAFRELLGGVWSTGIDAEVWQRLESLRSSKW